MLKRTARLSARTNRFTILSRSAALFLTVFVALPLLAWIAVGTERIGFADSPPPQPQSSSSAAAAEVKAAVAGLAQPVTVKAEGRGTSRLKFNDGRDVVVEFRGAAANTNPAQGTPLTLAAADFNSDGYDDVIGGYSTTDGGGGGGMITLYRTNSDAIAPRTEKIHTEMMNGRFPAPFQPEANSFAVPEAADFIGVGDFNRDGFKDVLTAARGGMNLHLLAGDGRGNFRYERRVELPGAVTTMLVEDVNNYDGMADAIIGIGRGYAPKALIYHNAEQMFEQKPVEIDLPADAASMAVGQMDTDFLKDLVIAAGNEVLIARGYDQLASKKPSITVERIPLASPALSVATGEFLFDREARTEIAVLTKDGTVNLAARGSIDRRPYTEEEQKTIFEKRRNRDYKGLEAFKKSSLRRGNKTAWAIAETPITSKSKVGERAKLVTAQLAGMSTDDLMVVDAASNQMRLVQNGKGETKAQRTIVEMDTESEVVAAVPLRLNIDNAPDIVLLRKDSATPTVMMAPAATINVDAAATDVIADNGLCSLREAIINANNDDQSGSTDCAAGSGADTIMMPAMTYTLAIGSFDQEEFFDGYHPESGDLDIADGTGANTGDLTIIGVAGQTIVQAGTTTTNGIDRVFDVNNFSFFGTAVNATFTNLIIRHGVGVTGDFGYQNPGGGIQFDGFDNSTGGASSKTLTLNNTTVTLNRAAGQGGGIFSTSGAANLVGSTISDNRVTNTGAIADWTNAPGGGMSYDGSSNTDPLRTFQMSGGTTFIGNLIDPSDDPSMNFGQGGGARLAGGAGATISGSVTSNDAQSFGGGFSIDTIPAVTISSSTISDNSAATGGGIFNSGGALSITGGGISGNVATAGKGGGIEHNGASGSVTGVLINNNTGSGILISGSGSLDAATNTITGNSGDGIGMTGTGVGSHFNSNTIYSNTELGIDLSDNGVTPNDAGDADTGPNNLQNYPVLNYVRRGDGVANVTLNAPNGKYRIQYYANTACDPSGYGEGQSLKATQVVDILSGNTLTFSSPAIVYGTMEQITATATSDPNANNNFDDDGSTSEFSACRQVNTSPTITAQAGVTRQQGSPSANSQIATVNDVDQAENTLAVTVNGNPSATVNGVTVSNILVDAGGKVTADVFADCSASDATFTLTVTDSVGDSANATLTVNVITNPPPTVGTYSTTSVNAGNGTTVTPSAAPVDNTSITSATVMASGAFAGTLSVDSTTGIVTIGNANPVGSYTVTVTFSDDCGATTMRTFTLNVVDTTAPDTTITANPSNPSNSNSASFSFTGTDTGGSGVASFECDLDGGGFAACTSPQTYSGLSDGSHTFQVRAIDNSGNSDATPASFTWTIDTTPPDTTLNSGPPNPSGSSSASFSFSGTDTGGTGVASFDCKLDGGIFAPCNSPQNYSGLSNGSHTFMVRAVDGVGNVDPTPASYTWTVDTVAPTVTINQAVGQADPTGSSPINFTAVFSEPVTGFGNSAGDVMLSGTAGATTFVITQIAPNDSTTYNVAVSGMTATGTVTAKIPAGAANDAAGNGNAASTSTDNTVTFVLNFPPTVVVAAGGSCASGASGTINLTVSDVNTPLSNVTLSASSSNTAVVPLANIVFGGSGANRTMTVSGVSQSSIQSSIITITVNDGQGGTSTVTVKVIVGTNQGETLNGTSGADMIFGLNGMDTINAGAGNDLMCGGNAKDTLTGGSGADFFGGGNGPDSAIDFNPGEGDTTDGD